MLQGSLNGDRFAIAKLISAFESIRREDQNLCIELEKNLALASSRQGLLAGLTGAPGAGKSTLIQHLVDELLICKPEWRIAVVAVDPSSPVSGGALLGDRTRINFGDNDRAYFRSQASDLDLGGIGRNTFRVCRVLRRLFDLVLIESVGVGQSEIEIARLADITLLALQPFSGDHIQFMKSGIMEIPQAFVITKCDAEDMAERSLNQLQSSLDFVQQAGASHLVPKIYQTSSIRKTGFADLAEFVSTARPLSIDAEADRENYFLKKEVRYYFGEVGLKKTLPQLSDRQMGDFEERRLRLIDRLFEEAGAK